jgi:hypothetical protein
VIESFKEESVVMNFQTIKSLVDAYLNDRLSRVTAAIRVSTKQAWESLPYKVSIVDAGDAYVQLFTSGHGEDCVELISEENLSKGDITLGPGVVFALLEGLVGQHVISEGERNDLVCKSVKCDGYVEYEGQYYEVELLEEGDWCSKY